MVEVKHNFEINEEEKAKYIEAVKAMIKRDGGDPESLTRIKLRVKPTDEETVEIDYFTKDNDAPNFERIARITGYLTSTVDRWNSAKQAELRDRLPNT